MLFALQIFLYFGATAYINSCTVLFTAKVIVDKWTNNLLSFARFYNVIHAGSHEKTDSFVCILEQMIGGASRVTANWFNEGIRQLFSFIHDNLELYTQYFLFFQT